MGLIDSGYIAFYPKGGDLETAALITHALIGSVTRDMIVLPTDQPEPLTADQQVMIVGYSGSSKTIPFRQARKVARDIDIDFPSRFTVPSLGEYLFKLQRDDDGKVIPGAYVNKPSGSMVMNEASAKFSESKSKDYMSGTIEVMSCLHDHMLPSEYYKNASYGIPQDPYISIIMNMVEDYVSNIPEYFWKQGLAGRILWRRILLKKPKRGSWLNTSHKKDTEEAFTEFRQNLQNIKKDIDRLSKPIKLELTEDADELIHDFRIKKLDMFEKFHHINPKGIHHHYLTRVTELLGKTALRFAISREYAKNNSIKDIKEVTKIDVEKGLTIVENSCKDLDNIFDFIGLDSDITKEDKKKRNKKDCIIRLMLKGHSFSVALNRTNRYPADNDVCTKEMLRDSELFFNKKTGKNELVVI